MECLFSRSIRVRPTRPHRRAATVAILGLGTLLSAQPSDLELAYASRIAYSSEFAHISERDKDPGKFLAGYRLMDFQEDNPESRRALVGFRAIALRNDTTRTIIIAYRGTDPALVQNVAVDAGMFLTIAGNRPQEVIARQLAQLGRHYGGLEGGAMELAAAGVGRMPASTDGGAWLHEGLKVALAAAGLPYTWNGDLRALTSTSCDHAIAFFKKTRDGLLKEAGDPEGSRITKALIRSGWWSDPRAMQPGGYSIYLTGHSLGGFLAQVVGATQGANTVTFAAPGAQEYLAARKLRTRDLAPFTVRQIFRVNDLVGSFGTHVGQSVPLCDFYDSPVERERLQAAVAAAERDLGPRRAAWLAKERETYRTRLSAYEILKAGYPDRLAEYEKQVAQREAERSRMGWLEWAGSTWAGAPARPAEPQRPVEPTEEAARRAVPNPYLAQGAAWQDWAKVHYQGVAGYFYTNHSLEGIIHQYERQASLGLTGPYPHAAASPEEAKTSTSATPASTNPEVWIEAPVREVAPGGDLIVSALKASGLNPGWTWTATAGTIVDQGAGTARFTAPPDAAEGTVITITAEEAASSSRSTPGRAVLAVLIKQK